MTNKQLEKEAKSVIDNLHAAHLKLNNAVHSINRIKFCMHEREKKELEQEVIEQLDLYSNLIKQIKIEETVFGKFTDPGFNEKLFR